MKRSLLGMMFLCACSGGSSSYSMRSSGGVRFGKFDLQGSASTCSGSSSGSGELFMFDFSLVAAMPIASLTELTVPPFATTISQTVDSGTFPPCMQAPWTVSPETPSTQIVTGICQTQSFVSVAYDCGSDASSGLAATFDPPAALPSHGTATLNLSGLLASGAPWSVAVDFPYSF